MPPLPDLLPPATYFPLTNRFTVAPGFRLITHSFGNGAADARLFQIDTEFARFRRNKIAARRERFDKYVGFDARFDVLTPDVCRLIAMRLFIEYPAYFDLTMEPGGAGSLQCHLTGERLVWDAAMTLVGVEGADTGFPTYRNMFDALLTQVPEDVAVVALPAEKSDITVALHVCAPSHWSPEEKIGQSFVATHAPVPGFEKIATASAALLEAVRTRPPVVRFNWGVEFTDRFNLHPEPPPGEDANEWNRRRIGADNAVYLRLERQVLWGMESVHALLFAIRVYVRPVAGLAQSERDALRDTLFSMPEASRIYKGLPPEVLTQVLDYI